MQDGRGVLGIARPSLKGRGTLERVHQAVEEEHQPNTARLEGVQPLCDLLLEPMSYVMDTTRLVVRDIVEKATTQ